MTERPKIRLFVDMPLGAGQSVNLSRDHAHYLFNVMRLEKGAKIALFNGQDGEWSSEILEAGKRAAVVECGAQSAPQKNPPDLWLLFAPIKKTRTDFIVEKAAEMGAAQICPVITEFTNSERVRVDRLQAHAVEAAEQCGGTFVPKVNTPEKLSAVLEGWDKGRQLMFCDETQAGEPQTLPNLPGLWAILIGPEGGFSPTELSRLRGLDFVHSVSLGPRILRADTASVAAMTLWQSELGDW